MFLVIIVVSWHNSEYFYYSAHSVCVAEWASPDVTHNINVFRCSKHFPWYTSCRMGLKHKVRKTDLVNKEYVLCHWKGDRIESPATRQRGRKAWQAHNHWPSLTAAAQEVCLWSARHSLEPSLLSVKPATTLDDRKLKRQAKLSGNSPKLHAVIIIIL